MNYETKRDVFEDALRALEEFGEQGSSWEMAYDDLSARYDAASDAALPDDLPVIPKAVGTFIKRQKAVEDNLATLFYDACGFDKERNNGWSMFRDTDKFLWAYDNQNIFARAWLDGVWRVEKTGEIVKLEAEK